jgi:hypothetical protein
MQVECITNKTSLLNGWPQSATPVEELLKIGEVYIVYGIYLGDSIAYEVLLDELDNHTTEFPSHLFKIVDNRLSSFFVIGESERFSRSGEIIKSSFISFPEWANDKSYFEKLVEGESDATDIFNAYRRKMEIEFRSPKITQSVTQVGQNWVQCPVCAKAWELTYPSFEMCKCPQCNTVLLNSRR